MCKLVLIANEKIQIVSAQSSFHLSLSTITRKKVVVRCVAVSFLK